MSGEANKVSYGGFKGIRTHYQEIYDAMSDNAELLKPVMVGRSEDHTAHVYPSVWGSDKTSALHSGAQ